MEYIPLRMGDEGPSVKRAQQMLKALGYFRGNIDGSFGPVTLRSVVTFQSDRELPIDGVIAANTWAVLEKAWENIRREGESRPPEPRKTGKAPGAKKEAPFQTVPPIPWTAETISQMAPKEPKPLQMEAVLEENSPKPRPWRKIGDFPPEPPPIQGLPFGSHGKQVADLQRKLTETGHYTGQITGFFGAQTANSLEAFQGEA